MLCISVYPESFDTHTQYIYVFTVHTWYICVHTYTGTHTHTPPMGIITEIRHHHLTQQGGREAEQKGCIRGRFGTIDYLLIKKRKTKKESEEVKSKDGVIRGNLDRIRVSAATPQPSTPSRCSQVSLAEKILQ